MKKILLILCVITLFNFSCKKDEQDDTNNDANNNTCTDCKLKEITLETNSTYDEMHTLKFQYNSDGNISAILVNEDGALNFNYQGDSCIVTDNTYGSNFISVYKLNPNKFVTKMYRSYSVANYNYYTDSLVINETIHTTENHTYKYIISNGDYISSSHTSNNYDPYYPTPTTTEYFTDKINKLPIPMLEFCFDDFEDCPWSLLFFIPKNQHLLKSYQANGNTYTCSYEFNSSNFITKLTLTEMPDNIQIYHFKYE